MSTWALKCPRCGGPVQYGRWQLVTLLNDRSQVTGWSGRWIGSSELVCPTPDHGVFERRKVDHERSSHRFLQQGAT